MPYAKKVLIANDKYQLELVIHLILHVHLIMVIDSAVFLRIILTFGFFLNTHINNGKMQQLIDNIPQLGLHALCFMFGFKFYSN